MPQGGCLTASPPSEEWVSSKLAEAAPQRRFSSASPQHASRRVPHRLTSIRGVGIIQTGRGGASETIFQRLASSVQSPILVNRGWVPRSWRDKALDASEDEPLKSMLSTSTQESTKTSRWHLWSIKHEGLKENVQAVMPAEFIGVVRGSEKPSIFGPSNDPNGLPVVLCGCSRACSCLWTSGENTLY